MRAHPLTHAAGLLNSSKVSLDHPNVSLTYLLNWINFSCFFSPIN
jgi:hypothetical protein